MTIPCHLHEVTDIQAFLLTHKGDIKSDPSQPHRGPTGGTSYCAGRQGSP